MAERWWPGPENDVYADPDREAQLFPDKGALTFNRLAPAADRGLPEIEEPWPMEYQGPTGGPDGRIEREMFGGDRQRRRAHW